MGLPRLLKGKRRRVFARLVANGLAQAAATIGVAWLIRHVFDDVLAGTSATGQRGLWLTIAGAVAAVIGKAALRRREYIDGEILAQSYAHRLRRAMYGRLYRAGPMETQRISRGAVMLRFIGDLTAITQWVGRGFARLLVAGVTAAATLTALTFIRWEMALAVATVLVIGVAVTVFLGRYFNVAVRNARRRRTHLASNIAEKVSAIPVVQALGQAGREQRRLRLQSSRLKNALITRARPAGSMTAVADATSVLAVLAAVVVGAAGMRHGLATPGAIIAFVTVAGMLAAPVRDVGRAYEFWLRAQVSREKLAAFLSGVDRSIAMRRAPLQAGPGRIELAGLGWGDTIRGATADAPPRARVVVTGDAGAGKSALLCLVSGLLVPETGRVTLDGQDVQEIRRDELQRAVGLVSPDLPLLRGTIDANLRYGAPDAAPEALARLEQLCDIGPMLAQLPSGRETRVAEGGRNLSIGQRQRIALVRAMLGEPRVLLLDDMDVALDPALRNALIRILDRYRGTILMVTRDKDLMARATAVWELSDGRLMVSPGPAATARPVDNDGGNVAFI